MPDWMSAERIALIASFGAAIVLVSKAEGGFLGIDRAGRCAQEVQSAHLPAAAVRQRGQHRRAHAWHRPGDLGAAAEIRGSGPTRSSRASAPAAPSWASGASSKHASWRARASARARRVADAVHRAQGRPSPHPGHLGRVHSADRAPGRTRRHRPANDGDAILMAQQLAHLGLAVGISSGANLIGALARHRSSSAPTPSSSRSSATATRSTSAPICCAPSRPSPAT